MRRVGAILLVAMLLTAPPANGQEPTKEKPPFADLLKQVQTQELGWEGDKGNLYPLFAAECKRLGERFDAELVKFVADDPDRHYWAANLLTNSLCLKQKDQRPELALLLLEQGAAICRRNMVDQEHRFRLLSTLYCATVLAERLGFKELASQHRAELEGMVKEEPILAGGFPAMGPADHKVYQGVPLPEGDVVRSVKGESRWEHLVDDAREVDRAIAADRKRLDAETFRTEVLKLVKGDPRVHFALAATLLGDPAFGKDGPLPTLTLLLLEQASAICHRDMVNQDTRAELVGNHYLSAVLDAKSGLAALASQHKAECETLLTAEPILRGAIPAMTDEEHKLYKSIKVPGKKE